ncbi:MAG: hypothetical protein LIO62_04325 [Clostridiales bacterium]|nr:hypothetical protein [Clostridiales bacterium]
MEAADGDVTLTFSAYAIQKTPFNDPVKAYTQETVSTAAELLTALEEGTAVTLSEDMSISAADLNSVSEDVFINLDGNTLTITGTAVVADSDNAITITNGDIDYSGNNTVAFSVQEGGNITLDSVTVTTENSSTATTIVNVEAGIEAAEINIVDSTLESSGYYVVSTNAGSPYSGNDVVINIENSTLTVTDGLDSYNDSCGVLFNINGTLNVTDSTITGERQGMIVRQGTANITDSTIATTGEYTGGAYYLDSTWKSGNEVPMAALVAGDRSTAYPDAVVVNLSGVTLSVSDPQGLDIPQLYAAAYNDVTTTITSDTAYDDVVESTDGTTLTITVA